jgi:hypothetical protein
VEQSQPMKRIQSVTGKATRTRLKGHEESVLWEAELRDDDGLMAPCAVNFHNTITVTQDRVGKRVVR